MDNTLIYKTIKTSLKSVIRDQVYLETIQEAVYNMDEIVTRSLLFLKLYILQNRRTVVTRKLIHNVCRTVAVQVHRQGRPVQSDTAELQEELEQFYNTHFEPLLPAGDTPPLRDGLAIEIEYATTKILISSQNNIKANFLE